MELKTPQLTIQKITNEEIFWKPRWKVQKATQVANILMTRFLISRNPLRALIPARTKVKTNILIAKINPSFLMGEFLILNQQCHKTV